MSHKRKGQLTMAGEWAKHLRKWGRRMFWKGERAAEKKFIQVVVDESLGPDEWQLRRNYRGNKDSFCQCGDMSCSGWH